MTPPNKNQFIYSLYSITALGILCVVSFSLLYLNERKNVFGYSPGFDAGAVHSLIRIFENRPKNFSALKDISLSAAGNEYENFQILIYNPIQDIPHIDTKLTDLISEDSKAMISKEQIVVRSQHFVETKKPYYKTAFVGRWPDALIGEDHISVKKDGIKALWLTVYVPPETPSGLYKGTVELKGRRVSKRIKITLKVWEFDLPVRGHLKTAFDLYDHLFPEWFPRKKGEDYDVWRQRLKDIAERYYEDMLKHRLSPVFNFDVTQNDFPVRMERYLKLGLNSFGIGPYSGTYGNNWPKERLDDLKPQYSRYARILGEKDWLDLAYIYTFDEGDIGNPDVATISGMIHEAHPKLKNMVCYHGFWDPDKDPEWGKDIDIWTFQFEHLNERKIARLKDAGLEVWMYPSGPGDPRAPNLAMDFPSMAYRIIPWMCWKYEVTGLLYWCVNWWTVDPYKNAANTKWEQNGNGLLYYPGPDKPVGSLRLEILRDGLEDHEYLYLLNQRMEALEKSPQKNKKKLLKEAARLTTIDRSLIKSIKNYTKNAQLLYKRREQVAAMIEKIDGILNHEP